MTQAGERQGVASARSSWTAAVVGLLMVAAAAAQAYGAWRLMHRIIRLNSFRVIDAAFAPPKEQGRALAQVGISEITLHIWVAIAWVAAGLLVLAGLWMLIRRRFAWRFALVAAVATILAGVATVVAGYVEVRYAGFPPLEPAAYMLGFLLGSAPGWVLLTMWLAKRLFRRPASGAGASPAGADGSADQDQAKPSD